VQSPVSLDAWVTLALRVQRSADPPTCLARKSLLLLRVLLPWEVPLNSG
jgi:hypothetical protein